jgi:hypothetical protein
MRDFLIAVGSVAGIYACIILWRVAKIIDRIERDVDNIRISKGLPPRNERYYAQDEDIRHQEALKHVDFPPAPLSTKEIEERERLHAETMAKMEQMWPGITQEIMKRT